MSLDAEVRRADEDRWLASRFAPRDVRERLIALYALNHEIARTAEVVREPAVGAIRLAWWRDGVAEVLAGKPARAHPTLQAFAVAAREVRFPATLIETMIEARALDLEAAPFARWEDIEAYVDATAGGVMQLAAQACGANPAPHRELFANAALAWGLAGLMRAAPTWQARGRRLFEGIASAAEVRDAVRSAYAATRARPIAEALFPALGYVALTPTHLRSDAPSLLRRQLVLVGAAARGRV